MKMVMTVYYLVTPMKDEKTCTMLAGPYPTWDDAHYVNELHYRGKALIAQHILEVQ